MLKRAVRARRSRLGRSIAALATAAIALALLFGSAASASATGQGPERDRDVLVAQAAPAEHNEPAIIIGPPPEEESPSEITPETDAEQPVRDPPPIARKKPEPPKKVSAPKPPQEEAPAKKAAKKKAPAKKAPAKKATMKAPAKAAVSPPQQAKDCDYCYGCESLSHACRRQWVCGKRYTDRLAAGLCRR